MIRTVTATRYVTPLREGGSLPAIVECDDGRLYVLKFVGAGQGRKSLIAELLAGEIGRALGLPVPEIVLVELEPAFGLNEPHEEIQDLLRASVGTNLALAYIPGALAFEPLLAPPAALQLASAIVWFDAFTTNVDRTARNTNMLLRDGELWLIDHGAALYVHHTWANYMERSRSPFQPVKDHVLLRYADALPEADAVLSAMLSRELFAALAAQIPERWLADEPGFAGVAEHRAAYAEFLTSRLAEPRLFVEEALHARAQLI